MQVAYLFNHIHSLDTNKILWLDFVVLTDLFGVAFVQFASLGSILNVENIDAYCCVQTHHFCCVPDYRALQACYISLNVTDGPS